MGGGPQGANPNSPSGKTPPQGTAERITGGQAQVGRTSPEDKPEGQAGRTSWEDKVTRTWPGPGPVFYSSIIENPQRIRCWGKIPEGFPEPRTFLPTVSAHMHLHHSCRRSAIENSMMAKKQSRSHLRSVFSCLAFACKAAHQKDRSFVPRV